MKLRLGLMSVVIAASTLASTTLVYAIGGGKAESRVETRKLEKLFKDLENKDILKRAGIFNAHKEKEAITKEIELVTKPFVDKFGTSANEMENFIILFGAKGKLVLEDLVSSKNTELDDSERSVIVKLVEAIGGMSANLYTPVPEGAGEESDIVLANKALTNLIITALPQVVSGENKTSAKKYVDLISKMLESMKNGSGKDGIQVRTLSDALRAGIGIEVLRSLGLCK